ncbi:MULTISPECIES: DUF3800 domain-containing protein [Tenacibaculum]|uniref:DUF3800 domain-containing protein n=1 Tax=Tenacibaculum TaxID=104267 RepID=UPI00187B59D0|nr:DUF3800 domain-containing protein [Tenacibaculum finnmarkense]MBE7646783.1 DUF3800 domain-containing protein [Tenacibaculum finnmarkense genomovar ulcerans]MCG8236277.1 DUF3800 domain-containing protein [Tenacibaculum finnmarkense genomovar ulcerans]
MEKEKINEQEELSDRKIRNIEKERLELLNKVLSGNLQTKHDKVGFILNNNTSARNSDIELAWNYWSTFENDLFNGSYITKKQLKKLTKISSLSRSRARIQNEYNLFQADDIVKKHRGTLANVMKDEAVEKKPDGLPMYSVYIDETGKTQQFLSVGSLWIVDGYKAFESYNEIKKWKDKNNINYEFHFAELTKHKLEKYKEFFLTFLKYNPTVGFKAIILNRKGIKNVNSAITDLTFHIINKGINHENHTGRAPLPRLLQVWIDEEEKGSDQLKIENLKERLSGQSISDLYLGDFQAVDSKQNFGIQIVDIFTASINRKIHNPNSKGKPKDELADYVFDLLKFDINSVNLENNETDKSTVFNLNHQ